MSQAPSQKEFWDAYGHALGAAAGLELSMRIALLHAAAQDGPLSPEERAAAIDKIRRMTLGGTATNFLKAFPQFLNDQPFVSGLSDGTSFRNHLAHNFLDGRVDGFRTEVGLKLLTLECHLATEHFAELERVVRAKSGVDFDLFFNDDEERAQAFVDTHPLRKHLAAIEAGTVPAERGLEWWGLDDEIVAEMRATQSQPRSPAADEQ